jgi:hypothetical protein
MKCRCAEFDNYFGEGICRKYGMRCCVACKTCKEPEWVEE